MDSDKQRYFIELTFNGGAYHGWQVQKNALTVQEVLDKVLSTILRVTIETVGCGRTDTGVHAKQLFAHFDVPSGLIKVDEDRILMGINSLLPPDIAVKSIVRTRSDAHARFDAVKRSYEYHIHFNKNPFLQGFSWQLRDKPNIVIMNEAAKAMLDYTDFSCFSKSHTQVYTNNCKLMRAEWNWLNPAQLVFYISADRFLRNMVRAIVGTLMEIGNGKQNLMYIHEVINSKNRSKAGVSVPACGLYLTEVVYPYELKK